jgi:hypothetical protein
MNDGSFLAGHRLAILRGGSSLARSEGFELKS